MKKDVINGFEWHIYAESEVEEARGDRSPRIVRIATTCDHCSGPIQASLAQYDARARREEDSEIVHSEGYHASLEI